MDLSRVLGILEGTMGTTKELTGRVNQANQEQRAGLKQATEATQRKNIADSLVALETARGQLQAETNTRRFATELGTNLDSPNEILTGIARQAREAALIASQESAKVAQMESRSDLTGNPAGFLYDLLFGDSERAKRDAALNNATTQKALLDGLNTTTTAAAQAQNAIKQTTTEASLVAMQESVVAANEALEGILKTELAGADYTAIGALNTLNSAEASQASTAYQISAMAEQRAWMRADREAAAAAKKEEKDADMAMVNAYKLGQEIAGPGTGMPVDTVNNFNNALRIDQEETARLVRLGLRAMQSGDAGGNLGNSPGEALYNIRALQPNLNEAQKLVVSSMHSTATEALSPSKVAEKFKLDAVRDAEQIKNILKDPVQTATIEADALATKAATDLQTQRPGDYDNFYAPPPIEAFSQANYYKENKWLQEYVAPQVEGKDFDLGWLTDRGVEAISKGDATTTEVVDAITWLSNEAILTNNLTKMFHKRLGLEPQDRLVQPVKIRKGTLFNSTITNLVDGTKAQDVTTVLNEKLSSLDTVKARDALVDTFRSMSPAARLHGF